VLAETANSYAISPLPNRPEPHRSRALSWRRASCLPQFDVKTLGLGRSGCFSLVQSMVVKQYGMVRRWMSVRPFPQPPGRTTTGRRDQHSCAARLPALGRLSYPRRGRARHHLDSGRAGSHAGGRLVGRAEGKPDAAIFEFRCRPRQQRLSRRARCSARSVSAG
jgi:hypothetical protein